jgi:hypothetical protein
MQRQESLNINHHYNNEFGLLAGLNQMKDNQKSHFQMKTNNQLIQ